MVEQLTNLDFEVRAGKPTRIVVVAADGKAYELTMTISVIDVAERGGPPQPNGMPSFDIKFAVNVEQRRKGDPP